MLFRIRKDRLKDYIACTTIKILFYLMRIVCENDKVIYRWLICLRLYKIINYVDNLWQFMTVLQCMLDTKKQWIMGGIFNVEERMHIYKYFCEHSISAEILYTRKLMSWRQVQRCRRIEINRLKFWLPLCH